MLYDANGKEIDTKALTDELASPSTMGVRQAWYDSVASGLTPEYLASVLLAVDQGDILNYLTLASEMEERDPHYFSVLSTRKLAVSGLSLVIEARTDDLEDVRRTDFAREVLHGEAVAGMLADLLDALGKGYSVVEVIWDRSGDLWEPKEFKHRDPRFFQFDRDTGDVLRLRDAADVANGIPLEPHHFLVHRPHLKTGLTIRGGLARLAVVAFMAKGYALKDWLAFAEIFGLPLRVGKYGQGASAAQKAELLRAVSNIGTDSACIIPDGMLIDFIESKSTGGEAVFLGLAEWLDRQISKAVLGQTATTEGTPGKLGADNAQENVRDDIRDSDAKQLAATIRRDLVLPLMGLNFGEWSLRKCPSVRIDFETPEDLESLSRSLPPFINLGLPVEVSTVLDKFGLPTPEAGAQLLKAPTPAPSPFGFPPLGGRTPLEEGAPELTPEQVAEGADDLEDGEKEALKQKAMQRITDSVIAKLRTAMALASKQSPDIIDEAVTQACGGWRKIMGPLLDPIAKAARESKDAEDFSKRLAKMLGTLVHDDLVKSIATLTFEARGLGDSRDRP